MAFNEDCEYLDLTKLDSDLINIGSKKRFRKKGVRRYKRPCLAKKEWVYDCPDKCPLFKLKL
jgi:hypothetical protein